MTSLDTQVSIPAPTPAIRQVLECLGELARESSSPAPGRLFVTLEPRDLVEATRRMIERLGARYVVGVGSDRRGDRRGFEVLHNLALDRGDLYVALRVGLDATIPTVPSITRLVPGASWSELEMRDLLGIEPQGHPDPRPLVLSEDFPSDFHPLRKDVPHDAKVPPPSTEPRPRREPPPGTTVIQLGPFFPVLEEPSQWRLFVDGENVVGADYRGFYCHRAIEKLGDSALDYNQVIGLAERICGICGCVHSTSYCQAVEQAAGIEVPERAKVVRTLMLEVERLQSHLLWLGLACHVVGFDYGFMHSWRLREPLLAFAEGVSGSRKHFGLNLVGGTRFDVTGERLDQALAAVAWVEREGTALVQAIHQDGALIGRLRGVGVLTREEIAQFGVVGPTARASGVAIDVRRDHPYAAYPWLEFQVVTDTGGDVLARTLVRIGEIFESVKLLRQCVGMLRELPEGNVMAAIPEPFPAAREGLGAVEAPRGEVYHYLLTDGAGPARWRVRAPSYQNLQAVPAMLKPGTQLADVPITIASIDPCFSCTERMETVDRAEGTRRVWKQSELDTLSRCDMARRRGASEARP